MSKGRSFATIRVLQIVLGVVLFTYAVQLVVQQLGMAHRTKGFVFLLALGMFEAVAAALFVVTIRTGGVLLLVALAAASIFHVIHGQLNGLGLLAVYAAAVVVVMSNRPDAA
ncbi:MAG: hypothetical protein JO187_06985 [Acidobacteria bacterium]|nr:hypothetical protein [Acidobacteriota bacterium]